MDNAITSGVFGVIAFIAVGFAFRSFGVFDDADGRVLRRFAIRLPIPVLVFLAMAGAERGVVNAMAPMAASLLLVTTGLFLVGWFCTRFVEGAARKTAVHVCISLGNYGWLGFGVAEQLYGAAGLQRAVFFCLLWWPVFFGVGYAAAWIHGRGRHGAAAVREALKVAVPVIGCMLLGVLFNQCGWSVGDWAGRVLDPIGAMAVPLILMSVGVMLDLSGVRKAARPAIIVCVATLVGGALIGWGTALLLGQSGVAFAVIVMQGAMPVATMTPALGETIDIDLTVTNTCIVLSTVLSLVTLTVLAHLIGPVV